FTAIQPMPWRQFPRVVLGSQETRPQLDLGLRQRATTSRARSTCLHRLPLSSNSSKKKTQGSIASSETFAEAASPEEFTYLVPISASSPKPTFAEPLKRAFL